MGVFLVLCKFNIDMLQLCTSVVGPTLMKVYESARWAHINIQLLNVKISVIYIFSC